DEALPLLIQIGQALDYAHSKNPPVVHLDLKPLNILLTVDGYAKITDFGLARVLRDLATRVSAWEAAGSLAYMAPEQIRGKGIGTWTDIYALAAVAYELLSGQPPFFTGDLRWQIMHETVDPIPDMPDHVNKALLLGLAKDGSMRPKTAGEFVKMLSGEIPVSDLHKIKWPRNEKGRKGVDAETEEPTVWKEEWFETFVPDEEKTPQKPSRQPVFMYSVITFLCLLVLAELGWILYSQNNSNGITVDRILSFFMPDKKGPSPLAGNLPPLEKKMIVPGEDESKKKSTTFRIPLQEGKESAPQAIGQLSLVTSPVEVDIWIDDHQKGVTPLVVSDLTEGTHTVKAVKDGFQPWQGEVQIQPSQVFELQINLKPITGSVSIDSKPNGALVFIEGIQVGTTPVTLEKTVSGKQSIEIQKQGYEKWQSEVDILSDTDNDITATLKPLPGKLHIISIPAMADVFISGKRIGKTPVKIDAVKEENLWVEVQMPCYDPIKRNISVLPGMEEETKFVLQPSCGDIFIKSQPGGADWYVNGKLMGKTPGKTKALEKGTYAIKVKKEKYADWETDVEIHPQKNDPIVAILDPIAELTGKVNVDPITKMEFVWVEKGCFQMGSSLDEKDKSSDENPVHSVCLDGFWIGKYEVTQEQWVKVFGVNPSSFQKGGDYPVENVSWNDAKNFISRLNEMNQGKAIYRLPTEAEWEYACRSGGKPEKYSGGDIPDLVSWFSDNSKGATQPVGKKKPNGLGLFDMSGNVFEWVEDVYLADAYLRHKPSNPVYNGEGSYRVCRGGSWLLAGKESRSTNRSYFYATSRNYNLGFRVVKNP
ncbi:MAG: PEGA domain-containing protein, partial [Deltaproteobacteria bacterium]